ncbi:hypothetical protein K431DRAFT_292426 [Polychaeton citri CBS 116435]|uniref:Uncharacterized protein n=1 Tax=Polychaeton citri CBS 116435 TaxID=1314669 RepID=A0A9P4USH1_9PEZI|nr:hypothetical protein K431DRAFT_292426 [Polychaeton citri CBS 116435]
MGNENTKPGKVHNDNSPYMHRSSIKASAQEHLEDPKDQRPSPSHSRTSIEILNWGRTGHYRDSFALTELHTRRLDGTDDDSALFPHCLEDTVPPVERSGAPACLKSLQGFESIPYYAVSRDSGHVGGEAVQADPSQITGILKYNSGDLKSHNNVTYPKPPQRLYRYSELHDPDDIPAGQIVQSPSGKMLTVEEFRVHPSRPKCIRERQESIMRSMSRLTLAGNVEEEDADLSFEEEEDAITPVPNGKELRKKYGKRKLQAPSQIHSVQQADSASRIAQQTKHNSELPENTNIQHPKPALRPKHSSLLRGELPGMKKVDFRGVPYGNEAGCKYVQQPDPNMQGDDYNENGTNNAFCSLFCGWDSPLVDHE